MNGAVYPGKVGAFRVVPYFARKTIKFKSKIEELIDMTKEELDILVERRQPRDETSGRDYQFEDITLDPDWEQRDPAELSDEEKAEEDALEGDEELVLEEGPRRSTRTKKRSQRGI
ncbi:hypothetical protein FB45DRAFT_1042178 [Roridomyces roridus]|uniref:Uncharacterized protein n=1 Tax=Roridomyces roridus TaxID=1738132 RepID=A0AAD7AZI0_9AGAR|nr:hypothetical protein FB45DRAFT_1042178 [Roridomyces roridus]